MDKAPYLLALNSTEGFLQLVVGEVPEKLLESATALRVGGEGNPAVGDMASPVVVASQRPKTRRKMASALKCSQEWLLPSQGAELLAPALHDVMERLGIGPENFTHIACVTGPGSFTGIRLTTTSAGGLAMATGALMGGIPYLPLLACNALSLLMPVVPSDGVLWVVTHARRDLVHAQSFRYGPQKNQENQKNQEKQFSEAENTERASEQNKVCQRSLVEEWLRPHGLCATVSEILVVGLDELVSLVSAEEAPVILFGSGVTRNGEFLAERFAHSPCPPVFLPESFDAPQASVLYEAACLVNYAQKELLPEYVRVSDAEESLGDIAVKLGLDAEEVLAAYSVLQKG